MAEKLFIRRQFSRGTRRAANIYSLVASCKLNDIDPFAYCRDVLSRISTHPMEKIDELLPSNWTPLEDKVEITAEEIAA